MDAMCPVWNATWHIFIGPHVSPKSPKTSDTWHPLVLPCHHANINMTRVTFYDGHICCMNDDFICTDVDITNTDVDSSLLIGLG
jgi:hypothetical protein